MGDPVSVDVDDWLDKVLTNVPTGPGDRNGTKLKKAYNEVYTALVKALDDKNLSGLMSQAVVPRLIRRMANIPKIQRVTTDNLKTVLEGNPEDNISVDYPYSRTQIMETYTRIQNDDVFVLGPIMENPIRYGDPLLGAAALIIDKTVPLSQGEFLGDSDRIQEFSMRVNLIQDVIVRHLIFSQAHLVPLVGDATLPVDEDDWEEAKKDSKKRALGLGENPNPEMAAILNPGLVMGDKEQEEYHRELVMLSSLISPGTASFDKSIGDAFKYAGFERSEAEVAEEVKDGQEAIKKIVKKTKVVPSELVAAVNADQQAQLEEVTKQAEELEIEKESLESELDEANEKLEEQQKTLSDLTDKMIIEEASTASALAQVLEAKLELETLHEAFRELKAGKGAPEPKLEKTVDYTRLAHDFLISHLGVDQEIIELTEKWMELYALQPTHVLFTKYLNAYKNTRDAAIRLAKATTDAQKGVIKTALTKKTKSVRTYAISSLMAGHEEIGVRRPKFYNPKKNVVLSHTDMIKMWAEADDIEDDDKPEEADLVTLTAHLGKEGRALIEKMDTALAKIKNISSSITESPNTLFFPDSVINAPTERRRRHKQKNRTDKRVLRW